MKNLNSSQESEIRFIFEIKSQQIHVLKRFKNNTINYGNAMRLIIDLQQQLSDLSDLYDDVNHIFVDWISNELINNKFSETSSRSTISQIKNYNNVLISSKFYNVKPKQIIDLGKLYNL